MWSFIIFFTNVVMVIKPRGRKLVGNSAGLVDVRSFVPVSVGKPGANRVFWEFGVQGVNTRIILQWREAG
jgi:hypothetical protein